MRNSFLYFLIICLTLAWVSPACKFRSGEMTWMEICGDFGVKTVAVPLEKNPLTPDSGSKSGHAGKDCAFCFASAHTFGLKTDAQIISLLDFPQTAFPPFFKHREAFSHPGVPARGPPVISA